MIKNLGNKIYRTFSNPDVWLAFIDLGNDSVMGKIKDNQALLEMIPDPGTGFHFKDIVEVSGPIGTTSFRDDQIPIYKAIRIIHSSNLSTFTFEAIVPVSEDWFELCSIFSEYNSHVSFPYPVDSPTGQWEKGYCIAPNIKKVKSIFEEFIISGVYRKVRNIKDAFNHIYEIGGEIDGNNFSLTLEYSNTFTRYILIILAIPLILSVFLAVKFGLKSQSEQIGFYLSSIFFCCLEIYSYLRMSREKIIVNKDGIFAAYPFIKEKSILWEDIINIKRSVKKNNIIIKNNSGHKIIIDNNLTRFKLFCKVSKNLVKNEAYQKVFEDALKFNNDEKWARITGLYRSH